MVAYLLAAGLLLHTAWWGAGLAALISPRRWRRFWPVFMPVCGWALQSLVVWAGAWLNLPGTASYAWPSQLLPAALLAWAWRREGHRRIGAALRSVALLGLLILLVLAGLVRPISQAWSEPTTVSLGSCDAADYAAGARLFHEFRSSDRSGFIGQTEVVQVRSADNLYDFFLRLNHFTPSALVAHHAAILGRAPHEVIGLLTATFVAAGLPLVFWVARATLRLRTRPALLAAAIYGFSAVNWYGVYHVAMAQFLAAQAITLLTIAGVAVWRELPLARSRWSWMGLLVVASGLIFGAYNFIIVVALAPAGTYVLGAALAQRRRGHLLRWLGVMLLPMGVAGAVYAARVGGLVERFLLFQEYDFGWRIPGLTPEGWLGLVKGPTLETLSPAWRLGALGLLMLALGWSWARGSRRGGQRWMAFALTGPAAAGYGFLLFRGAWSGTHASYDAYKILSVFYPGILPVLLLWWPLWRRGRAAQGLAATLTLLVLLGNAASVRAFTRAVAAAPLVVDAALLGLRQIERLPEVDSINILPSDMWSRLWANAFLLQRRQFFATHTYEGRRNTALDGAWNLTNDLISVRQADPDGARAVSVPGIAPYQLVASTGRDTVAVVELAGWYELEQLPRERIRWRWITPGAEVVIENAGVSRRSITLALEVRSVEPRELVLRQGELTVGQVKVGTAPTTVRFPPFELPPGRTALRFDSPSPGFVPGPHDPRVLLVCVSQFDLHVREE